MLDIITREEINREIYDAFFIKLDEHGLGENFDETTEVFVYKQSVRDGFYVILTYKINDNKSIELTRRNIKTFEDLQDAIYTFDYLVTLVRQ